MNQIGSGIVTSIMAWLSIPIVAGVFLVIARLIERVVHAQFDWSVLFVLSIGIGIIGSIFVGMRVWSRLAGGGTEEGKGKIIRLFLLTVFILAIIRFLF